MLRSLLLRFAFRDLCVEMIQRIGNNETVLISLIDVLNLQLLQERRRKEEVSFLWTGCLFELCQSLIFYT